MTLNSEGLLPCPFCGGENAYVQNAGWKANTFIRCPDCPSSFATSDGPRPHEDSVVAWNRRALPPVDGLEVVEELNRIIAEEAADFADAAGHAIEAGERPDLWDREAEISVHTLSQASSVIAGLKEANEALLSAYERGRAEREWEIFESIEVHYRSWAVNPDAHGFGTVALGNAMWFAFPNLHGEMEKRRADYAPPTKENDNER